MRRTHDPRLRTAAASWATPSTPAGRGSGSSFPSFFNLRDESEDGQTDVPETVDPLGREDAFRATGFASEQNENEGDLTPETQPVATSSDEPDGVQPEAGVDEEPPLRQASGDVKPDVNIPLSERTRESPVREAGDASVSAENLAGAQSQQSERETPSDPESPRSEQAGALPFGVPELDAESADAKGEASRGSSAYAGQAGASEEELNGVDPSSDEGQRAAASSDTDESFVVSPVEGTAGSNEDPSGEDSATRPVGRELTRDTRHVNQGIFAEDDTSLGALPVPLPQDTDLPNLETDDFVVPGNMTVPLYHEALSKSIETSRRTNGGRLPVIHLRWHSQESFVESAAQILNEEGKPYFYVVAGEYTQTPVRRMGFFQSSSVTSLGPLHWPIPTGENADLRESPFFLPRLDQLIDSSLNITSAVAITRAETDTEAKEHPERRERETLMLRWIPYGLTRIVEPGAQADGLSYGRNKAQVIQSVRDFVTALQRKMPNHPVKTVDGREVVVVVNDRRPELELLLGRAMDFAPSGTPVIVTDSEAFAPEAILPRIRLLSRAGERIHFVVFGVGRYGQLPLNAAFLDRAVLRVPRPADIDAFVQRHSDASAAAPAEETEPKQTAPGGEKKQNSALLSDEAPPASDNFLILNPFTEFLMRFNYTEVDNVAGYAEALTQELRHVPITFFYKNETRRVAVVLLTDFPEAESVFLTSLLKLNVIVQVTIAVAMIIGLLACLCMCRMMFLLKSR
ncbi:conserved hypothetical protein [Neospora caninum Liverpool]|nr:conserved hypothetical protein [Neospora caninum Liverpool]CBZ53778.1 conserved hypothetical protein [Neospora caninum Liverpool]|eukprot:XP_003883810.1 conserved hypothetical protein [Neospora caninum Liverpool]